MRSIRVVFSLLYFSFGACSVHHQDDNTQVALGSDLSGSFDIGRDFEIELESIDAEVPIATNPVGSIRLWPSMLPDCVEQVAYQENAIFEIPPGQQQLSRDLPELRRYADSLPEGYTSIEATVLSSGVALIAL